MGWSALGVLYLHEYTFGYDPQPGRAPRSTGRSKPCAGRSISMVAVAWPQRAWPAFSSRAAMDEAFDAAVQRALSITPGHPGHARADRDAA